MNWRFWQKQPPQEEESRYSLSDWLTWMSYAGNAYQLGAGLPTGLFKQTLAGPAEPAVYGFQPNATDSFGADVAIFALMSVRQHAFSGIRFAWQREDQGRPGALFTTAALQLLQRPWQSGTTQDLLVRAIQDADLAGNFYAIRDTPLPRIGGDGTEIVRLRPDWTDILLEERIMRGKVVGYRKVGFLYYEQGPSTETQPTIFGPEEVAHFAPLPDPLANYRGMSWLTPVAREISADKMMTTYKNRFLENGATPNMIISFPPEVDFETAKSFRRALEKEHKGPENAGKRLYVGGGADATVVGANFQQIDFKAVQGAGETRLAAAAGVPPVIVGFSEGLQGSALNAGNYVQSRRRFSDITMHTLWANVAGSFEVLAEPRPPGSSVRLTYDARDVPLLREDAKDAAEIIQIQAGTIANLVKEGFIWDTVIPAVTQQNMELLKHSGLMSVQLQKPGEKKPGENGKPPEGNGKVPPEVPVSTK
jgi:phage portal protein BeeE